MLTRRRLQFDDRRAALSFDSALLESSLLHVVVAVAVAIAVVSSVLPALAMVPLRHTVVRVAGAKLVP